MQHAAAEPKWNLSNEIIERRGGREDEVEEEEEAEEQGSRECKWLVKEKTELIRTVRNV